MAISDEQMTKLAAALSVQTNLNMKVLLKENNADLMESLSATMEKRIEDNNSKLQEQLMATLNDFNTEFKNEVKSELKAELQAEIKEVIGASGSSEPR